MSEVSVELSAKLNNALAEATGRVPFQVTDVSKESITLVARPDEGRIYEVVLAVDPIDYSALLLEGSSEGIRTMSLILTANVDEWWSTRRSNSPNRSVRSERLRPRP